MNEDFSPPSGAPVRAGVAAVAAPKKRHLLPIVFGVVGVVVFFASKPAQAANLPPELNTLDTQFQKLQAERVSAPFDAELAKLNTGYLGGLDREMAKEKAAGHLDDVLALEEEKNLIAKKQPVPESDDDKTSTILKGLRATYRTAYAKLASQRAVNLKTLSDPLEKRLAQMEADFTKADRLADAKVVRGYRAALGESSPGLQSTTPTASMPPPDGLKPITTLTPATTLALKDGIINTLGMKFLPVKGTDVLFCIHETRYKDYAAYATETPDVNGSWKDQSADGFTPVDKMEDHPVIRVSWEEAQGFCAWLSKKEGKTYRLPTDQEWSIAVGIGRDERWKKDTTPATVLKNQTDFPWGDKWPPPKETGNYSDQSRKDKASRGDGSYLVGYDDGFPTTAPVMRFKPNKLGLCDMSGNVYEWCEDWYDNVKKDRVLRGGSWDNDERENLLSSYRNHHIPGYRNLDIGFRVVISLSSAP